jgi:hypothetical protein
MSAAQIMILMVIRLLNMRTFLMPLLFNMDVFVNILP